MVHTEAQRLGYVRRRKRIRFARRHRPRGGLYHSLIVKKNVKATTTYPGPSAEVNSVFTMLRDFKTGGYITDTASFVKIDNVVDRAQYVCYDLNGAGPINTSILAMIHGYMPQVSMCDYFSRWSTSATQKEYQYMMPLGFTIDIEPLYSDKILIPDPSGAAPTIEAFVRHHLIVTDTLNIQGGGVMQFETDLAKLMVDPRRRTFTTQRVSFYVPILHRQPASVTQMADGVPQTIAVNSVAGQVKNRQWYPIQSCASMFGKFQIVTELTTTDCGVNIPSTNNQLRMFRVKMKLHCHLAKDRVGMTPTSVYAQAATTVY